MVRARFNSQAEDTGNTASLWAAASPEKQQRIKHPVRARRRVCPPQHQKTTAAKGSCRIPHKKHLWVLSATFKPLRGTHSNATVTLEQSTAYWSPAGAGWPAPSYTASNSASRARREAASSSYRTQLRRADSSPGSRAGTANQPLARTRGTAGPRLELAGSHSKTQPGLWHPSTESFGFVFWVGWFFFFLFQHSSAWLQFSEEQIGTFIGHSFLLQPAAA